MTGIMVHVTNLTHPGVIVTTLHRKKTPIDDGQYGPRNSQYGLRDQFDAALPVVPFAPLGVTRVLRPHHETVRGVAARVAFERATFEPVFHDGSRGRLKGWNRALSSYGSTGFQPVQPPPLGTPHRRLRRVRQLPREFIPPFPSDVFFKNAPV